MTKALLATCVLLLAAAAAEAATGRDPLVPRCNVQKQLVCGNRCVNFLVDPNNCGKCGLKCDKSHICVGGGCVCPKWRPQECGVPGLCTNPMVDPMNCGNCGNICPSGACVDGLCVGGDDGCGIDQIRCKGVCRNIFVDESNCGACGVTCKGGSICVGGGCVCPPNNPDICTKNVCTNKLRDPKLQRLQGRPDLPQRHLRP
ncbi:hypothetical protein ABPG77_006662 [Micractinium sp. CCAP 211/92]